MAAGKGIRAGAAFVEIFTDNSALRRGLNRASKTLKSWGKSVASIGAKAFAVGGAMLAPFGLAIKAAGDLQEIVSKFGTVFGEQAGDVDAWAADFSGAINRTKTDVLKYLAGTQDLLVPLGIDPKSATQMSKDVTSLAYDLASFNNMAEADVMRDLQAALTGSSAVMKKYGVIVNAAAVKQELLNQGLDPSAVTEAQKAQARLAIIMRGTTAAQGDTIRTMGSFTNRMKQIKDAVGDLAESIGGALLPIVTPVVAFLGRMIKKATDWASENKGLVVTIFAVAAGITAAGVALVTLGGIMAAAGFALSTLATILGAIGAVIGAILSPIGLIVAAIGGAVVAFVNFTDTGRKMWASTKSIFGQIATFAKKTFGGITDALAKGDLALAGKIAFLALKVAAYKVLTEIKDFFGQTFGAIIGYLTKGDFAGAWGQLTTMIRSTWQNLWLDVVTIFTAAADIVVKYWTTAVKSVAGLIEKARQIVYKDQNEEGKARDKRAIARHKKQLAYNKQYWQQVQKEAEAAGGSITKHIAVESVNGIKKIKEVGSAEEADFTETYTAEQAARAVAETERGLKNVSKGQDWSVMGQVNADADAQAKAMQDWLAKVQHAAESKAAAAEGDLANSTAKGLANFDALASDADAALKEWQAAIAEAEAAKKEAADKAADEAADEADDPAGDPKVEKALSIAGTFNAAAVRGMGASGPAERIAKATEKTEKNTKDILREAREGGLKFTG